MLKIEGATAERREARLQSAQRWMENRGWRLVDYSPAVGSAMFERDERAPPLGWLDASRWLPGPDWFQPRAWLAGLRLTPRRLLLAGGVGMLVAVAFVTLLHFSHTPTTARRAAGGGNPEETWLYVSVDSLNVRGEPKPGAQIVGVLYRNQRVMVEKGEGSWARVVRPQWGFVSRQFLKQHPVQ
jgi:hypothetical protein